MKNNTPMALRRALPLTVMTAAALASTAYADRANVIPKTSANAVTAVQQSLLDSTGHHMDILRSHIRPAHCNYGKMGAEMPQQRNGLWMVYEGGYDRIKGDSTYKRYANGLLMGLDRQLNCNATLGVAFGYEHSNARQTPFKATDDTYFIDLYSAVRTGCYNHKFTVGVGLHDIDTTSGGNMLTMGNSGSMDTHTINAGYELSRDFRICDRSFYTPFLTVNYAYVDGGDIRENGAYARQINYDSMNLLQAGLGVAYHRTFRALPSQHDGTFGLSLAGVAEFSERHPDATINDMAWGGKAKGNERKAFFGQLGMTLNIPMSDRTDMVAGAYGRLGQDRSSVTGNVGLRYAF